MSAYGAILSPSSRGEAVLPSTIWILSPTHTSKDSPSRRPQSVTIHHVTLATAQALPGLVQYLHEVFADELERGMTYPQEIKEGEIYTQEMFESYYFAADVLVAVVGMEDLTEQADGAEVSIGIEAARQGRDWSECIAGCYYVSPTDFEP